MEREEVYLLGIDVGTTSVKVLLINISGEVISSITKEYPLLIPKPGWAEQRPDDWFKGTIEALRTIIRKTKINPEKVKGIGLTGQMHGLVMIDRNHKVIENAILWCDQRTEKQCRFITEKIGEKKLIELVSNPALTGFTAGKLLWIRENKPDKYSKIYKILLPKDFIRFKLTGEFATDVSDASGTLLFNVKERIWSDEILTELQIDKNILPDVFESTEITGSVTKKIAELTGLREGTPVIAGGGDQAAQAVGTGIVEEGIVSATIGTSGVVFAFTPDIKLEPEGRVHTFCHAVPYKWHVMGVMLSAGGSLKWFRDNFCSEEKKIAERKKLDVYDVMLEKCKKLPPGCNGLIFLPYLTGERTPHKDPFARGVFFGLNLGHTKSHLIKAVLEGITFGMKDSLEIIKEMGIKISSVRVSGGGAKSSFWRRLQCDIYGFPVETVNVHEGAAYGCALLAGVGVKIFDSVKNACTRIIKVTSRITPDYSKTEKYNIFYSIYKSLYKNLKEEFKKISI